jgi:hypothetical protein
VVALAGYVIGVGLHALWNLVATLGAIQDHVFAGVAVDVAVLLLPGVWTLLAVVHFGWRRERRMESHMATKRQIAIALVGMALLLGVDTGAHVMVFNPGAMADAYPKTADDPRKPYVMWPGTPYQHLVMPVK